MHAHGLVVWGNKFSDECFNSYYVQLLSHEQFVHFFCISLSELITEVRVMAHVLKMLIPYESFNH